MGQGHEDYLSLLERLTPLNTKLSHFKGQCHEHHTNENALIKALPLTYSSNVTKACMQKSK